MYKIFETVDNHYLFKKVIFLWGKAEYYKLLSLINDDYYIFLVTNDKEDSKKYRDMLNTSSLFIYYMPLHIHYSEFNMRVRYEIFIKILHILSDHLKKEKDILINEYENMIRYERGEKVKNLKNENYSN